MEFNNKNVEYLQFIYDRMKHVHNENENVDYMLKFKEVIKELEAVKEKHERWVMEEEIFWMMSDEEKPVFRDKVT